MPGVLLLFLCTDETENNKTLLELKKYVDKVGFFFKRSELAEKMTF